MTKPVIYEKSCGVVLFKDDVTKPIYLLLHYGTGHWDFAKGHVEEGETEVQTALRELEEETGITEVELKEGFRATMEYSFPHKKNTITKTVVFFCGQAKSDNVTLSHEHQNFIWLDYESALKKLTFENAREMLTKVDNFLRTNK